MKRGPARPARIRTTADVAEWIEAGNNQRSKIMTVKPHVLPPRKQRTPEDFNKMYATTVTVEALAEFNPAFLSSLPGGAAIVERFSFLKAAGRPSGRHDVICTAARVMTAELLAMYNPVLLERIASGQALSALSAASTAANAPEPVSVFEVHRKYANSVTAESLSKYNPGLVAFIQGKAAAPPSGDEMYAQFVKFKAAKVDSATLKSALNMTTAILAAHNPQLLAELKGQRPQPVAMALTLTPTPTPLPPAPAPLARLTPAPPAPIVHHAPAAPTATAPAPKVATVTAASSQPTVESIAATIATYEKRVSDLAAQLAGKFPNAMRAHSEAHDQIRRSDPAAYAQWLDALGAKQAMRLYGGWKPGAAVPTSSDQLTAQSAAAVITAYDNRVKGLAAQLAGKFPNAMQAHSEAHNQIRRSDPASHAQWLEAVRADLAFKQDAKKAGLRRAG